MSMFLSSGRGRVCCGCTGQCVEWSVWSPKCSVWNPFFTFPRDFPTPSSHRPWQSSRLALKKMWKDRLVDRGCTCTRVKETAYRQCHCVASRWCPRLVWTSLCLTLLPSIGRYTSEVDRGVDKTCTESTDAGRRPRWTTYHAARPQSRDCLAFFVSSKSEVCKGRRCLHTHTYMVLYHARLLVVVWWCGWGDSLLTSSEPSMGRRATSDGAPC